MNHSQNGVPTKSTVWREKRIGSFSLFPSDEDFGLTRNIRSFSFLCCCGYVSFHACMLVCVNIHTYAYFRSFFINIKSIDIRISESYRKQVQVPLVVSYMREDLIPHFSQRFSSWVWFQAYSTALYQFSFFIFFFFSLSLVSPLFRLILFTRKKQRT